MIPVPIILLMYLVSFMLGIEVVAIGYILELSNIPFSLVRYEIILIIILGFNIELGLVHKSDLEEIFG